MLHQPGCPERSAPLLISEITFPGAAVGFSGTAGLPSCREGGGVPPPSLPPQPPSRLNPPPPGKNDRAWHGTEKNLSNHPSSSSTALASAMQHRLRVSSRGLRGDHPHLVPHDLRLLCSRLRCGDPRRLAALVLRPNGSSEARLQSDKNRTGGGGGSGRRRGDGSGWWLDCEGSLRHCGPARTGGACTSGSARACIHHVADGRSRPS